MYGVFFMKRIDVKRRRYFIVYRPSLSALLLSLRDRHLFQFDHRGMR